MKHSVVVTETAKGILRSLHPALKRSLRKSLDDLAEHPFAGKPLQAELSGLWSLRVSRYRIIYQLAEGKIIVIFIGPRRTVYEQLRELLLKQEEQD